MVVNIITFCIYKSLGIKKLIINSISMSFSLGLDWAINNVIAIRVLLSITCLLSLYKML